jgi:gluconate 2-dehydrogenase gamma chain
MGNDMLEPTRRSFIDKAIVTAVGIAAISRLSMAAGATAPYRALNSNEAAFTEAMVNALCRADHLTPNGVDCGLAAFIDRQLAGEFGARELSLFSLELTQEKFFKLGISAMNVACEERFGCRFDRLTPSEASGYLHEVAGGSVEHPHFPLTAWLNQIVDPLLIQASFAGPIYEKYRSRVFWKLFGHTEAA